MVLRKTSFTIRERFTPSQSMLHANPDTGQFLRLWRFCHGLTRPCAAFFRLVGLLHFGGVPLKAGVLIQDCSPWIAKRFGIDDLFVMHCPGIRLTQIAHALGLGIDHHDVLVTMRFLLAAVVQGLLGRVFQDAAAADRSRQ